MSDRFSFEIFDAFKYTDGHMRQVFIEIIVTCFLLKGYREVTDTVPEASPSYSPHP